MTKLDSWLEAMKGPGWPSHPRSKEAIAVIEKLKAALEFYSQLNDIQVKATWAESNPKDKECAEIATQVIQQFWEPLTEKARAVLAIDPEKL